MPKRNKVILIVLGFLFVGGFAFTYGNAELFQGRMFNPSKPLPAYDENKCNDSDGGKNYDEAGTVYGKFSRSEFGNRTDVCVTRTKLKEYYCKEKFIQDDEYNCENGCSGGACKLSSNEQIVKIGDKLVFNDYILKVGEIGNNYVAFALFREENGEKIPHPLSPVQLSINNAQLKPYVGYYGLVKDVYLALREINLVNKTAKIQVFNSCSDVVKNCKINEKNGSCSNYCVYEKFDGEIQVSKGDFIGFSSKDYNELLNYMVDSFNLCDQKIMNYTGLKKPAKPIYFKIFSNEETSPLGAKWDSITFTSTPSNIMDNQDRVTQIIGGWGNYQDQLQKNICPSELAQGHELVHIFLAGTPIGIGYCAGTSGVCGSFNEGLAEYLKYKINDDEAVICEEDGFKYSYQPEKLYSYYNFSSEDYDGDPIDIYNTGLCMWDYVEKTYGHEAFKAILKKLDQYRNLVGQEKSYEHPIYGNLSYTYNILDDFIVPFTSDDIYKIFEERFGITKFNTYLSIPRNVDYFEK